MNMREFEQRLAEEEWLRSTVSTETVDGEEYADDDDEDEVGNLLTAASLLENAKRLLGFFGDKKLSADISKKDRKKMLSLAEEIKVFLDQLEDYSPE